MGLEIKMSIDWKEYLLSQGAVFQGSSLTGFSSQTEFHHTPPHENVISVLSHKSFITVSGPDAQKFLQGQISVHMEQLSPNQHRLGVACTPKGRMYTSFRLLNTGNDYLFSMDKGIVEHTLTTLGKYAAFFKSDLKHTKNMIALGLSGKNGADILTQLSIAIPEGDDTVTIKGGYVIQIEASSPRFEFWINSDNLSFWWEKLMTLCTPLAPTHWQLLDIESVIPSITEDTLEKYIPQHLNMPTLGGVSFRKGCYTGQEIVTRMQSLGQQKSRTYHLQSPEPVNIQTGDKIYDGNGKPIGETLISLLSEATSHTELLAVIRSEVAEQGKAYLDADQKHPVHVLPLPYTVDSKAELQQ
ncbi:hypothetical protein ACH42_14260 [Endozoicomonas sp. (ex Bugula neritina AB1)]|nr:hypothetical protein ACH42_14260 [Endozoicomonas sp. (ex Bugula neritina AB1)]